MHALLADTAIERSSYGNDTYHELDPCPLDHLSRIGIREQLVLV